MESALPTFRIGTGTAIAQLETQTAERVGLDAPALSVLTDLTRVRAVTTTPSTSLRQAEQAMIVGGVRMLLVVTDAPTIEGLITATDLRGEKQMRLVHERNAHYDELSVGDVMTDLSMLDAVDFRRMATATVGDVIATLTRFGRDHLLVVEDATAQHPRRVRGIISRTQIERQTGTPIAVTPIASTFSEVERALF